MQERRGRSSEGLTKRIKKTWKARCKSIEAARGYGRKQKSIKGKMEEKEGGCDLGSLF